MLSTRGFISSKRHRNGPTGGAVQVLGAEELLASRVVVKSPLRGKLEARRARRFQGRWLPSFLFSLSQAAPSVSCTVVLGTDAVLPGRGAIFQYPPTHLGMWYWLRTSAAGGKLAAEAMREIKDAIR